MEDKFYYRTDGKLFFLRSLIPADKNYMREGYGLMSMRSKFLRFFSYQKELTNEQLKFYTAPDGDNHVAWGVLDVTNKKKIPAGTGRYIRVKNEAFTAEVAITIVDQFHKLGLGTLMIAILNFIASRSDIKKFRYHIHDSNLSILKLLKGIGKQVGRIDHSTVIIEADIISDLNILEKMNTNLRFVEAMRYVNKQLN